MLEFFSLYIFSFFFTYLSSLVFPFFPFGPRGGRGKDQEYLGRVFFLVFFFKLELNWVF